MQSNNNEHESAVLQGLSKFIVNGGTENNTAVLDNDSALQPVAENRKNLEDHIVYRVVVGCKDQPLSISKTTDEQRAIAMVVRALKEGMTHIVFDIL